MDALAIPHGVEGMSTDSVYLECFLILDFLIGKFLDISPVI
jgi:hypothetical protein